MARARGWWLAVALTGLVGGCARAPEPAAMARALVVAQPSGEAMARGDWTRLDAPSPAQTAQMAEQGVSPRAWRAGLAALERDAAYRQAVTQAMLGTVTR